MSPWHCSHESAHPPEGQKGGVTVHSGNWVWQRVWLCGFFFFGKGCGSVDFFFFFCYMTDNESPFSRQQCKQGMGRRPLTPWPCSTDHYPLHAWPAERDYVHTPLVAHHKQNSHHFVLYSYGLVGPSSLHKELVHRPLVLPEVDHRKPWHRTWTKKMLAIPLWYIECCCNRIVF